MECAFAYTSEWLATVFPAFIYCIDTHLAARMLGESS
jgi:hypothetical protein